VLFSHKPQKNKWKNYWELERAWWSTLHNLDSKTWDVSRSHVWDVKVWQLPWICVHSFRCCKPQDRSVPLGSRCFLATQCQQEPCLSLASAPLLPAVGGSQGLCLEETKPRRKPKKKDQRLCTKSTTVSFQIHRNRNWNSWKLGKEREEVVFVATNFIQVLGFFLLLMFLFGWNYVSSLRLTIERYSAFFFLKQHTKNLFLLFKNMLLFPNH
jgi:hypothetical protein